MAHKKRKRSDYEEDEDSIEMKADRNYERKSKRKRALEKEIEDLKIIHPIKTRRALEAENMQV